MLNLRRFFFALVIILMSGATIAPALEGQAVVEFDVVAWGAIVAVSHDCPIDERDRIERYAPAEVSCTLRALDADSLWTPASFTATSSDSSRVAVTVQDSTLIIQIVRRAGVPGVRVRIEAHPILFLAGLFSSRSAGPEFWAAIDTIPPINLLLGEGGKLCAYQGGFGNAIAKGLPGDGFNCPDFGPMPLPTFPVTFRVAGSQVIPVATGPPHEVPFPYISS